MKYGFDNEKYLRIQSEHIKERIAQFGDKLYLELGGKLFDDYHASRVLPGFQPDSKLRMLQQLSDCAEIVIVISANDIEKNKVRADYGITYDMDVLRLRTEFQNRGFLVSSVVITHFNGQASAKAYKAKLKKMGIKAYYHYTIEGYPNNVALIDSEEGYGKNDYVQTSRPLGQRKDGRVPQPALPRAQEGNSGGLCQIRDVPCLEPSFEAPGQHRLRGRHRRPQ